MRCVICNCTNDLNLYDELSAFTIKRFYPDPNDPVMSVVCSDCAEEVYTEDQLTMIENREDGFDDNALDEETETEIYSILSDLDEMSLKKEENYDV